MENEKDNSNGNGVAPGEPDSGLVRQARVRALVNQLFTSLTAAVQGDREFLSVVMTMVDNTYDQFLASDPKLKQPLRDFAIALMMKTNEDTIQ